MLLHSHPTMQYFLLTNDSLRGNRGQTYTNAMLFLLQNYCLIIAFVVHCNVAMVGTTPLLPLTFRREDGEGFWVWDHLFSWLYSVIFYCTSLLYIRYHMWLDTPALHLATIFLGQVLLFHTHRRFSGIHPHFICLISDIAGISWDLRQDHAYCPICPSSLGAQPTSSVCTAC